MSNAFKLNNVVKSYSDFTLGPLDMSLEAGTVLGYVGPNGSGKTTTMHCMTGLVKADQGEMSIFGQQNHPNIPAWKLDIGYVGDVHVFYERWTAAKNLKFISQFYPNWSDQHAQELISRFALPLNKKAKDLSTGNRVKLALVSALAHSPRLLLLDEPTAGLDPIVRAEVLDTLFEVLEDGERAIFYSTHILSDISRLADELAFLVDGKVTLRADKDNLIGGYRRISFRLEGSRSEFDECVDVRREGAMVQVISKNAEATLKHLTHLDVEQIHESRMTIDEIAVLILKNGLA
ncbi:ABC transporter ATP-binding protein [bacterium]|nr:ABC transporter ATP-binding protein [bacterium]